MLNLISSRLKLNYKTSWILFLLIFAHSFKNHCYTSSTGEFCPTYENSHRLFIFRIIYVNLNHRFSVEFSGLCLRKLFVCWVTDQLVSIWWLIMLIMAYYGLFALFICLIVIRVPNIGLHVLRCKILFYRILKCELRIIFSREVFNLS